MEATLEMTQLAYENNNRFSQDKNLLVKFQMHPVHDQEASAAEGRPIFKDLPHVQIMVPGDKDSIIFRLASEEDKRRFSEHYRAFMNNEAQGMEGTPLEQWPMVTRSQVEELKYFNVRTVEQLANLSDANAQNFMAINALRSKAQEFLSIAKENAPLTKLQAELEERDARIQAMETAMEDLKERVRAAEEED